MIQTRQRTEDRSRRQMIQISIFSIRQDYQISHKISLRISYSYIFFDVKLNRLNKFQMFSKIERQQLIHSID